MEISYLIIINIALVMLIIVLINFRFITREIRDICSKSSGYFKLGQFILMIFVLSVFGILLIINILNNRETTILDVFLTITVGFLGTIFGLFYGSKAESEVSKERRESIIKTKKMLKLFVDELKE